MCISNHLSKKVGGVPPTSRGDPHKQVQRRQQSLQGESEISGFPSHGSSVLSYNTEKLASGKPGQVKRLSWS